MSSLDHEQDINDYICLTPDQQLWINTMLEAVDEYINGVGEKHEEAKKLIFGKFNGFSIFDYLFDSIFSNDKYNYMDPESARIAIKKKRIKNMSRIRRRNGKSKNRNGRRIRCSVVNDYDRDTGNIENDETESRIEFILFGSGN